MKTSLKVWQMCVAVAVVATAGSFTVTSALAQAQGGRRGFGGGMGMMGRNPLMLLNNENVQKELELSEDQKKSIGVLESESRETRRGLRDLSPDERMKKLNESNEKIQAKVDDILLPNQRDRLQEITLQARSNFALASTLTDSKVADQLKLTDDQKKQLGDIASQTREKMMELFQGGGPPDREAMAKLRTDETDKANAVLTSDQKDEFAKMQGKKIDPELLRGGFGRGGRNRGGNGGGGGNGNNAKGQPDA